MPIPFIIMASNNNSFDEWLTRNQCPELVVGLHMGAIRVIIRQEKLKH